MAFVVVEPQSVATIRRMSSGIAFYYDASPAIMLVQLADGGGVGLAGVTFRKVNKVFGKDVKAVNDLNLDIKDKEFMVLVGPSGCGKTTALRMIAGLEEATDGEILIGENVVNDVPPK